MKQGKMSVSKRVSLDLLRPGVALSSAIADPRSPRVKLLGAGVAMTENFIAALRRRSITSVILSNSDIAILQAFSAQGRRTKVPPHLTEK